MKAFVIVSCLIACAAADGGHGHAHSHSHGKVVHSHGHSDGHHASSSYGAPAHHGDSYGAPAHHGDSYHADSYHGDTYYHEPSYYAPKYDVLGKLVDGVGAVVGGAIGGTKQVTGGLIALGGDLIRKGALVQDYAGYKVYEAGSNLYDVGQDIKYKGKGYGHGYGYGYQPINHHGHHDSYHGGHGLGLKFPLFHKKRPSYGYGYHH